MTTGPFDTRGETVTAAQPLRDILATINPELHDRATARHLHVILEARTGDIGIEDRRVADRIATMDLETVTVIASWVERAHGAAEAGLRNEIETLKAQIASITTKVRTASSTAKHSLPEGARVSTRHGIGTIIDPANSCDPGAVVELDVLLRNATVRTVVMPVDDMARLDGTHFESGDAR